MREESGAIFEDEDFARLCCLRTAGDGSLEALWGGHLVHFAEGLYPRPAGRRRRRARQDRPEVGALFGACGFGLRCFGLVRVFRTVGSSKAAPLEAPLRPSARKVSWGDGASPEGLGASSAPTPPASWPSFAVSKAPGVGRRDHARHALDVLWQRSPRRAAARARP